MLELFNISVYKNVSSAVANTELEATFMEALIIIKNEE